MTLYEKEFKIIFEKYVPTYGNNLKIICKLTN